MELKQQVSKLSALKLGECSKINACYIFVCIFFQICQNSNFWILQASAATYWRYGGKYYMNFAGNLLLLPSVKEFWKSVKNWQSYCHEFGVLLFWETVYSMSLKTGPLRLIWYNFINSQHLRISLCRERPYSIFNWRVKKF